MRVLVTGGNGFVGQHLVRELQTAGHQVLVHGIAKGPGVDAVADITRREEVRTLLTELQPEGCIHLAGIAFVPAGWADPLRMYDVNLGGVVNLLEAARDVIPSMRCVVISSSQIYGAADRGHALGEDERLAPEHIYGVAKMAADLTALLYPVRYGLPVMSARPCNHVGPGQSEDFVVPSFARQLIEIAARRRPAIMRVGNLDSTREFADVRDVVRAYRLLLERGQPGQAYNVATSRFVTIRLLLDLLARTVGVQPQIEVDPALFRPTDTQPRLDTTRLQEHTGWSPRFTLEDSLRDIVAAMRAGQSPG